MWHSNILTVIWSLEEYHTEHLGFSNITHKKKTIFQSWTSDQSNFQDRLRPLAATHTARLQNLCSPNFGMCDIWKAKMFRCDIWKAKMSCVIFEKPKFSLWYSASDKRRWEYWSVTFFGWVHSTYFPNIFSPKSWCAVRVAASLFCGAAFKYKGWIVGSSCPTLPYICRCRFLSIDQ